MTSLRFAGAVDAALRITAQERAATRSPVPQVPAQRGPADATAPTRTVADLRTRVADRLYREWYCAPTGHPGSLPASSPPLPGLLRTAHAAAGDWQSGWRTRRAAGGSVLLVERPGPSPALRVAGPGGWVPEDPRAAGLVPEPGAAVRVRVPHEMVADGWWFTWGGGWSTSPSTGTAVDGTPLVRLYLAPFVDAVADVVTALTTVTASWRRPWMLKAAVEPRAYVRADAVVLYLPRECAATAARELRPVVTDLAARLRPVQPPLTLRVSRGAAVAEDPPGEQSFGEHRCAVIAAAVVAATHDPVELMTESADVDLEADAVDGAGIADLDELADWVDLVDRVADAVAAALAGAGIDPGAPHRATRRPAGAAPSDAEEVPWDAWWG